jgi:DNA-binding winged helix-turn-helix (wHTH) protein/tetratricopeptide (TPR) repeat protein
MDTQTPERPVTRFGPFEIDLESPELRRAGVPVRIQKLPLQLLSVLLERPGHVVTRQELQKRLWPADTFVDFEDGLNTAIKKLREALEDSAEKPRYVETVPRRGYRFVAPVEAEQGANGTGVEVAGEAIHRARGGRRRLWFALSACLAALLGGAAVWLVRGWPAYSFHRRDFVLIADFENRTGDARFDDALLTAFTIDLEQSRYANVFPRTRLPGVLKRMEKPADARITPELGLEICQRENIRGLIAASITRTGQEYALSAELLDPQTGTPARTYSARVAGEDHILDALDAISGHIRADLGESLYQIHEASRPLPQVTTASLTALKEYADGNQLWRRGKFDDAVAQFQAAAAADPGFAMAHAALGNAYYSHIYYRRDLGKQEYERALALSTRTTDRERLQIQADFADSMGHTEEADRLYRMYLSRYPDDLYERFGYARLLRMHGRQAESIEQDQEIVRIEPTGATAYVDMATAYKTLGKTAEALSAYRKAFQLEPTWLSVPNVNLEYSFTLVADEEQEKARQTSSLLLDKPETRAAGERALAMLELYSGRYTSAKHYAEEALASDQKRKTANQSLNIAREHFLLAVVAQGQGNRSEQLRQLDAALADFEGLGAKVEYGSLVGQEYARAGATVKAEEVLRRIEPLADPNNPEQSGYLLLLKGEIARASGKFEEAEKLLTLTNPEYGSSVLRLAPEALAHAYFQAGKTEQAIASYERFLSPYCPAAWLEVEQRCQATRLELAAGYMARGDPVRARQAIAPLLDWWKDADANLPLRKKALELQEQLSR